MTKTIKCKSLHELAKQAGVSVRTIHRDKAKGFVRECQDFFEMEIPRLRPPDPAIERRRKARKARRVTPVDRIQKAFVRLQKLSSKAKTLSKQVKEIEKEIAEISTELHVAIVYKSR